VLLIVKAEKNQWGQIWVKMFENLLIFNGETKTWGAKRELRYFKR